MDAPDVAKFPRLFEPVRIGPLTARNRVKYAACSVSNFNTPEGLVAPRELARMEVVAATGAGIITNQGAYPDPRGEGKAYIRQLSIADDRCIPGLAKVAEIIHRQGAIAIQQILHAGRYGGIDLPYCVQPSGVAQTLAHFRSPREMTKDEIRGCIREHADAARRAIAAGFDGVEVTAFMGYLVANFLSPFTNKRTDEYGGSLENRGRFLRELLETVKEATGGKILFVRLNGDELMDEYGGSTQAECVEYMTMAEGAGADAVSIVIGWHESRRGALGRDVPTDAWLPACRRAKAALRIPVMFGPRFGSPVLAENALAEGALDFWEVCRPFLADPELLHKVREDRFEEIRPCLGELVCLARMFRNLPYICTVNARLGHEVEPEYTVRPAALRKRVLVIGGGPAGMEFAITSARRGHEVTVVEREPHLGGQLHAAAKEPAGGAVLLDLVRYYETQLARLGVTVRLGEEAGPATVKTMRPDVVVLATGACLGQPEFLSDGMPVLDAYDILAGRQAAPGRVVIAGGDRLGLVTAEHLSTHGTKVVLVEPSHALASDVAPTFRWRHLAWVKEFGIDARPQTKVLGAARGSVRLLAEAGESAVEADAVILAGPRRSRQELLRALEYAVDELHVIGDAVSPRSLPQAIHEGYRLGARV